MTFWVAFLFHASAVRRNDTSFAPTAEARSRPTLLAAARANASAGEGDSLLTNQSHRQRTDATHGQENRSATGNVSELSKQLSRSSVISSALFSAPSSPSAAPQLPHGPLLPSGPNPRTDGERSALHAARLAKEVAGDLGAKVASLDGRAQRAAMARRDALAPTTPPPLDFGHGRLSAKDALVIAESMSAFAPKLGSDLDRQVQALHKQIEPAANVGARQVVDNTLDGVKEWYKYHAAPTMPVPTSPRNVSLLRKVSAQPEPGPNRSQESLSPAGVQPQPEPSASAGSYPRRRSSPSYSSPRRRSPAPSYPRRRSPASSYPRRRSPASSTPRRRAAPANGTSSRRRDDFSRRRRTDYYDDDSYDSSRRRRTLDYHGGSSGQKPGLPWPLLFIIGGAICFFCFLK
jgi:hypothetical protein